MAHMIYTRKDGKASMAFTGLTPWHGLGQSLTANASIETWTKEAAMDFKLLTAQAQFIPDGQSEAISFDGQFVVYRSDNFNPMSVVSNRYQIVQPKEVIEFFRSFAEAGDMTLETAGSIQDGKKFWALAKVSDGFEVAKGDQVKPYVLLASSCDKTMGTVAKLTSIRVVCNNTLTLALGSKSKNTLTVPHSTKFKPQMVKQQMGLVEASIDQHANIFKNLHDTKLTDEQAAKFFLYLVSSQEERESGKVDIKSKNKSMPKLLGSYKNAPGAEDTLWGAVNAVTHSVDFNPSARTNDTRLNSAWFGQGELLKSEAYQLAQDQELVDQIATKTSKQNATGINRILDMIAM